MKSEGSLLLGKVQLTKRGHQEASLGTKIVCVFYLVRGTVIYSVGTDYIVGELNTREMAVSEVLSQKHGDLGLDPQYSQED